MTETNHLVEVSAVQSALADAGIEATTAAQLAGLALPSIRLGLTPVTGPAPATGTSRLGGAPDLPADASWPSYNGLPMSFVGQIRLEEAAAADAEHILPPAGMLWFFYDAQQQTFGVTPTDRAGWQVFFRPMVDDVRPATVPDSLPAGSRFAPCVIRFTAELTLPLDPTVDVPGFAWANGEQQAYETFLEQFPTRQAKATTKNRMLGYPDALQDDVRVQAGLLAEGISVDGSDPRATEIQVDVRQWALLLQVDSAPEAHMRWADAGMLYFCIERQALANHKFDNVWLALQSD